MIASSQGLQPIVIRAPAGKNYGPEMNLFVDHSQLAQVECLRSGIGGTASVWGRVLTCRPDFAAKS
jgi:phosphosulfolactate synthase (CoM biosynthesis protein A)